jgi:RimJ/RimL family protein N-acetyltransferase
MGVTFESDRLVLRRFTADDWPDLYEYLSDEEVVRYEPYKVFSEDESRREAVRRSSDEAFWAVCLKDDGKLIGNVYFQKQMPEELMTWEIGFVFNSKYHGRGYALEACR